MAHEVRGILLETIVEAALRRALQISGIPGELYWNEKPDGMTVTPDLTIGIDKHTPSHIILVTASGAEHNSHMKMWRNLGEIFEAKAQLATRPRLISIYGISRMKEHIRSIMDNLPDASLHLDQESYGTELLRWIQENRIEAPKTNEAKHNLLDADLASDDALVKALELFAQDLTEALMEEKETLVPVWNLMRADYLAASTPPSARVTSVRRGLGKLLVLEPSVRRLIYNSYKQPLGIPFDKMPEYPFELGLVKKTLAGVRVDDEEVIGALDLLGPEMCETLIARIPPQMEPWIDVLRQLENVPKFLDFIGRQFNEIADPDQLYELLMQCQEDPEGFAKAQSIDFSGHLSRNWLFSILMDLIKASTGKLTGFGYAQLAGEIGESEDVSSGYITIADWANRVPDVELPSGVLRSVTKVLADKVRQIGVNRLPKLRQQLVEFTRRSFLEIRIIPYRNFEPLLWLLQQELERQNKHYIAKETYRGWVNEFAGVGKKSATTPFVRAERTLIHWKTVSDAGKYHKRKELAARARSVKYQYHPETETFTHREGVDQLALIVDGTFNDADLRVLAEAGWDTIVYPDEIEAFVQQL